MDDSISFCGCLLFNRENGEGVLCLLPAIKWFATPLSKVGCVIHDVDRGWDLSYVEVTKEEAIILEVMGI